MATAVRRRIFVLDRVTFSWTAVLAGVAAALTVQVMLTMLGIGIGLLSIDSSTATSAPSGISWGTFAYWAIAGIIAAFLGGWVAGAIAEGGTGAAHGLSAWAVATLIVVGAAAVGAGSTASIGSNLVGPTAASVAHLDDLTRTAGPPATVGQRARGNQQDIEAARKVVATGMLASFIALLIGAAAAFVGGLMGNQTNMIESDRRVVS